MAEQEATTGNTGFVGIRLQEEFMQLLLAIRETYGLSISDAIRFCIEFTYQNHGRAFPLPEKDIENLQKLVDSGRFKDIETAHTELFHIGWDAYTERMLHREPAIDELLEKEKKKRLAIEKNEELARRLRKR
ncbi:MAG: hypothetical protein N3F63_07490 [Thermoplasmata archaeon]|nr:hypothetical protein [Thermoplasmata archaeon]